MLDVEKNYNSKMTGCLTLGRIISYNIKMTECLTLGIGARYVVLILSTVLIHKSSVNNVQASFAPTPKHD